MGEQLTRKEDAVGDVFFGVFQVRQRRKERFVFLCLCLATYHIATFFLVLHPRPLSRPTPHLHRVLPAPPNSVTIISRKAHSVCIVHFNEC